MNEEKERKMLPFDTLCSFRLMPLSPQRGRGYLPSKTRSATHVTFFF